MGKKAVIIIIIKSFDVQRPQDLLFVLMQNR